MDTPDGFGEYVRAMYDRAMINAGLADWEIEQVNKQFDHLIAQALYENDNVVQLHKN